MTDGLETYRVRDIVTAVTLVTGVQPHQLAARRRNRGWAHARQLCWLVIYDHGRLSLPEIGRQFDRDHTTVCYGISAARKRVAADATQYAAVLRHLRRPERAREVAAAEDRVLLRRHIAEGIEKRAQRRAAAAAQTGDVVMDREWWAENDRRFRDAMLAAGVRAFHDIGAAP